MPFSLKVHKGKLYTISRYKTMSLITITLIKILVPDRAVGKPRREPHVLFNPL